MFNLLFSGYLDLMSGFNNIDCMLRKGGKITINK